MCAFRRSGSRYSCEEALPAHTRIRKELQYREVFRGFDTAQVAFDAVCDLLGVRYPLIQAPMAGGWTTPELVAAVSNAGGFGSLAGAGVPPERLREDIRAVKERTDRPFAVNFLLAPPGPGSHDVAAVQHFLDGFRERFDLAPGDTEPEPPSFSLQEQLEVVFEEGVPVLSVALGDPGDLVERAHGQGMLVASMVATVEDAVRDAEGGVDVVVAQGAEAGGHRSTVELGPDGEPPLVGTLALVPQVVDAVGVPVVAAGGIWMAAASSPRWRSGLRASRWVPASCSPARAARTPSTGGG